MKIEIIKYDKYNDFEIKIDDKTFTQSTEFDGFYSYGAINAYILKRKYNAEPVQGTGKFLSSSMRIRYKGKEYYVNIGKNSHEPGNARYFMNVTKSHMKHLDEAIAEIDKMPIYTFEV